MHGFAWISPQPVMIKIWYVWWSGGQEMSGVRPVFRSSRGLSLANQAELPGPGNAWDDQWLHLTHVQKLRSSAYFDIFPLFVTFFHIGERINIQIIGFLKKYWKNWHGKHVTENGEDTRGWGWVQPCHPCTARCAPGTLRGWIDRTKQAWSSSHLRLLGLRDLASSPPDMSLL